jgi:vanillate O-demethylase monooxygenase subunit
MRNVLPDDPQASRLLADGVRSAFEEDRVILNAVQQGFATTHSPNIDIAIDSAPLRFRRRLRQLIDGERDARAEPHAT